MARAIHLTAKQTARFWRHVEIGAADECWPWRGVRTGNGYGYFYAGRALSAHRVSLALDGRDPMALCGLHRCDNPPCVNPAHLFVGSHADNAADRDAKGRNNSPTGARNGAHTKPERRLCGETHWTRSKPDRVPRGEAHYAAKLSAKAIPEIRASSESLTTIARRFGVSVSTISLVRLGKVWAHVSEA